MPPRNKILAVFFSLFLIASLASQLPAAEAPDRSGGRPAGGHPRDAGPCTAKVVYSRLHLEADSLLSA